MKVAAYQAPLAATGSAQIIGFIREQIDRCETSGVEILCCPEAVIGGLADYARRPADIANDVASGQLAARLAPLASDTVTTIVGFTEIDGGALFNAAAVLHKGAVAGVYRKLHPAINRSIYGAGDTMPVFTIGGLTFGILICNDSNYDGPARVMAAQGATALFVPSNNGMPPEKGGAELIGEARRVDIARATGHHMFVIRADVAGRIGNLVSHGSSGIVGPDGAVLQSARPFEPSLLVAVIDLG